MNGDGWVVHHGSCLDVLPTLPDESVDAVVTDPPYELGFMGKKWDSSGIAFDVRVWVECLRVLKPGGHLLAFGGSRTWHRIAVAIEDAGFDVRDSIAWLYGSGFPKSLDISKAIDRETGENRARQLRFTEWMRSTGITAQEINEATKTQMGSHYLSSASQPAIATADLFDVMRHLLPEVPEEIERLVAERTGIEWTAYKQREVIGKKKWSNSVNHFVPGDDHSKRVNLNETAPATDEAKKWQGWGTALKPAFEPIIVARKPLIGTVAENVLAYGTGGLNIDGTRIGTEERTNQPAGNAAGSNGVYKFSNAEVDAFNGTQATTVQGRWPANVMLDEFTAALLDEQSGVQRDGVAVRRNGNGANGMFPVSIAQGSKDAGFGGSGGASRFFYVAKASKRDRNEGLDELKPQIVNDATPPGSAGANSPRAGAGRTASAKNFHPTVKPTDLMRYLVKLVTPPGGTVLDPFTGSGSTGKAAILEGFNFIGIELTEDYLPIIKGRLNHAVMTRQQQQTEEEAKEAEALF